jgi:membrane-bound serine protease (ClpP class)
MLLILALVLALLFLPWPWSLAVILAAACMEVAIAFFGIRYTRRRRAIVGLQMLVGQTGEAITALNPDGQVKLNGEIWNGHTSGIVALGEVVRVTAVHGLTVEVEPASVCRQDDP